MSFIFLKVVIGATVIFATTWLLRKRDAKKKLPPGPSGKPVIGNISDLPAPGTQDWMHWLKHKQLYGV